MQRRSKNFNANCNAEAGRQTGALGELTEASEQVIALSVSPTTSTHEATMWGYSIARMRSLFRCEQLCSRHLNGYQINNSILLACTRSLVPAGRERNR